MASVGRHLGFGPDPPTGSDLARGSKKREEKKKKRKKKKSKRYGTCMECYDLYGKIKP